MRYDRSSKRKTYRYGALTLEPLEPRRMLANDHGSDADSATRISVPGEEHGEINPGDDSHSDWFVFSAVEGTAYHIQMDTDLHGAMRLVDASGNQVGDTHEFWDSAFGPPNVAWVAESSGDMFVVTSHPGGPSSYSLSITELVDDHGNDAGSATPVSVPSTTAGEMEVHHEVDWFVFTPKPETTYRIVAIETTPLGFSVRLLDSSGQEQPIGEHGNKWWMPPLTWQAESDAPVFMEVSGGSGSYQLLVSEFIDDFGDDANSATDVTVPLSTTGKLDPRTEADWLAFQAVKGVRYLIESGGNESLRLWDTGGRMVLADTDFDVTGGPPQIVWSSDTQETMFLEITESLQEHRDFDATYKLEISELPDDHGDDVSTATDVSVPSIIVGGFEAREDVDWFAFSANEGMTYLVETTFVGGSLRLLNADGQSLLATDEGGATSPPQIKWQASSNQTLHVSANGWTPGSYTLRISELADDHGNDSAHATVLSAPSNTPGKIDVRTDVDWFAFSAVAGTTYIIDTDVPENTVLRLLDTDADRPLDENLLWVNRRLRWQADSDRIVFVEVKGRDSNVGDYTLELSQLAPNPSILPDSDHNGQFDQRDLVQVLAAAKYMTGERATWEEGDWDGNGVFDQLDLVLALQSGRYLQGPLAATSVDPESETDDEELVDVLFSRLGDA